MANLFKSRLTFPFVRYEKTIETPQDILDRGMTFFISNSTILHHKYIINSLDPVMRRAFQEASLAKNGLMRLVNGKAPPHAKAMMLKGQGLVIDQKGNSVVDGDVFYYSRDAYALEHTYFPMQKNHWIRVCPVVLSCSKSIISYTTCRFP